MKFGEFLREKNLISEGQLTEALEVQRIAHSKIGRVLVELGAISQEDCNSSLAEFLELAAAPRILHELEQSKDQVEEIQAENALAFIIRSKRPVVAMRVFDDGIVAKIEREISKFKVVLISRDQEETLRAIANDRPDRKLNNTYSFDGRPKAQPAATPYSHLFLSLLKDAKERRASDVHFDSGQDELRVRFRIDGDLTEVKSVRSAHAQPLLAEVKRATGLPLTVVGIPSSGAERIKGLNLKVRAQSNGQIHGETIVLRIIDEERTRGGSLESLGADPEFLGKLKSVLNYHCGLVLICGPTGSGKSWTLYSTLMSLDRERLKVISIEDPVEYEGEGITQIEVTDKRFGFADALKSCLRLDPDVLMIGEIRDEETAELAFKAASTGHLVLSTLHTNGAIEAIQRLRGLGIADDLIASNIRLIGAQTLRKRLCAKCRTPVSDEDRQKVDHLPLKSGDRLYTRNEAGCESTGCIRGSVGQALLVEAVDQKQIRERVESGATPNYRSLLDISRKLAIEGVIGVEEVLHA